MNVAFICGIKSVVNIEFPCGEYVYALVIFKDEIIMLTTRKIHHKKNLYSPLLRYPNNLNLLYCAN